MSITKRLKQVQQNIDKLEFDLAVQKAVREHLQAIDKENQPSLFQNSQSTIIPGSMPSHIEAVLRDTGKPMKILAIAEAVKQRGAAGKTHEAIMNNVRGTLKRRADLFTRHRRGIYRLRHKVETSAET